MSDIDSKRPGKYPTGFQRPPVKTSESLARTAALTNGFGNSSTAAQIIRQQREVNKALQGALGLNSPSMKALQHLTKLASQHASVSNAALGAAHPSWNSELKRISKYVSATQGIGAPTLKGISHAAVLRASREISITAPLTRQITVGTLADNLKIEQSVASSIRSSLTGLENSYAKLAQSFEGIEDLVHGPAFVLPGATHEVVTTGRVMASLLPTLEPPLTIEYEFDDQLDSGDASENSDLVNKLGNINPSFATMYSGALVSLENNNPDRARHVLVSLRELADKLLDELAPHGPLKTWIDERGDNRLLHDGKPTRRAKILFILKELDDKPLLDFVEADARTMLELFGLYNKLHTKKIRFNHSQLRAIVHKSESNLRYLLQVRDLSEE